MPPAETSTPVLRVEGLTSGYGPVTAVRDLHLQVNAGEIVGLLGPNGAGKTTTLLTISGFLRPSAGTVRFVGKEITGKRAHQVARTGVGHVSEDKSLFRALTTRENLKLGFRTRSHDFGQVLGWFPELEPLLDRKAGLLSGGEQQMLAVARALVGRPRLLLIDEMSMGLAPIVVERLFQMMGEIQRETGLSVLLVEQYVSLALEACERIYVLNHGACLLTESAASLRENPSLLEAAYMGSRSDG